MEEILQKFFDVVADPYTTISQWKEGNKKKVIGVLPMHIPEEVIHAAGVLPVIIWRSNEPVTWGHAHFPPFNCGLTRSFVDDAVKGKLTFLDGMVFYRMCLQAQALPFIINRNVRPPFLEYLYLPAIFPGYGGTHPSPVIKDFLLKELERLKAGIEKFSGQEITTQALNRSIAIYNHHRALLRRLYELRRQKPGAIKGKEIMAIIQSSMLMLKEEHNELLEKLLSQLEKREPQADKGMRVMLAGCLCQTPQFEILDMIEDLGMVIVDDDIYVGSRYFAHDVEVSDKPLEALAQKYLKREPPCPTKGDWETHWGDYIIRVAKRNRCQGVIDLLIKFCPPMLCYYPDIKRKLAEAGIPEVLIEVEHEIVGLGQVRTRLQTFVEIMKGGEGEGRI
jgi:benzoyl-CoA reductase subunit C